MAERLVVVGTSLGGLSALEILLAGLPRDFPWPVAVVQHRSSESGHALLSVLQRYCALSIREPHDKETITPGHVYIAPPDYHLIVEKDGFALSTEATVNHARPSIDVLFETAADAFGPRVVAIVLTGASRDGARGAERVRADGGLVIVQDPETAECGVMPRAAMPEARPEHVLQLSAIAPFLVCLAQETGKKR